MTTQRRASIGGNADARKGGLNALDWATTAARRESDLRKQLEGYLLNVRVGRVERDDDYERDLRHEIGAAQESWNRAMAERRRERDERRGAA